jgi:2-keto-4-pentenoate hydratase/2-oxohepta-3-ene-1,7-dioic acid hydratase in catechol pathway
MVWSQTRPCTSLEYVAPIPLNWLYHRLTVLYQQLLSPIGIEEVPLIRCLGLNYRDHAKEANMPIPDVPVLFIKPRTALNGPYPAKINVPKIAQDGSSDYEAELSIILSKTGRDIPEEQAMDYVLGYTCSNDVSARTQQFKNSQWCFSKGSCTYLGNSLPSFEEWKI